MRKIPTVFKRNPEDMRRLLLEVHPDCHWVLAGEGVATRKYDGTCVMCDDEGNWWARREVKPGKPTPQVFMLEDTDPNTGKVVGWEPASQSGFAKWINEAVGDGDGWEPGTYELCGPKVQGNPEGFEGHVLIPHEHAEIIQEEDGRDFETLRSMVLGLGESGIEGVVFHHPDGRMAKLKARDFPRESASVAPPRKERDR